MNGGQIEQEEPGAEEVGSDTESKHDEAGNGDVEDKLNEAASSDIEDKSDEGVEDKPDEIAEDEPDKAVEEDAQDGLERIKQQLTPSLETVTQRAKQEFLLGQPYWVWIGAALVIVAILLVALPSGDYRDVDGTLVVVKGEATVVASRKRFLAAPRLEEIVVAEGDTVSIISGDLVTMNNEATGQLLLQDHVVIDLFPGTQIEVQEHSSKGDRTRYLLKMLAGRAYSLVPAELTGDNEFVLSSPSSSASVQGTEFVVEVLGPESTYYASDEGTILVRLGDQEAEVNAGEEVTAIVGQPLEVVPQRADQITDDFGHVLVLVAEGEFQMGSDDPLADVDEQPIHAVTLDAYYIDQTEVAFSQYATCVDDGACNPPATNRADDPEFADYPVTFVTWEDANDYCEWRGIRLPTEAEWEKAARWDPDTGEMSPYPWGDEEPDATLMNYLDVGDTTEVGSYPDGASPNGALDMAGNVWEWVQDWYSPTYYAESPDDNPQGPDSSPDNLRVIRGGDFVGPPDEFRSANREAAGLGLADEITGFRCASDLSE